jgi:hypothetical protein
MNWKHLTSSGKVHINSCFTTKKYLALSLFNKLKLLNYYGYCTNPEMFFCSWPEKLSAKL